MKTKTEPSELDLLADKIYDSQFHEEDEDMDGTVTVFSEGAEQVLKALQNLKQNPALLGYVIKCLAHQGIHVGNKQYSLTIHNETIMQYNEKIHKNMEAYTKHCIEGDFGRKKWDTIIKKVFNSIDEAKDYAEKEKHEKYSINQI